MKITTQNSSKPKLSKKLIKRKDTQTRSTLNSGRSSTYNTNKRHSHEFIYETQLLKSLNKSTNLCLNLNSKAQSSTISHKVIHEKSTSNINGKTQTKGQKDKNTHATINMKKVKETFNKYPSKDKKTSIEANEIQRFHSHRQSLIMNRGSFASHQVNSQEKENICANLPSRGMKRSCQQGQKLSLNKLSFILDKNFKEKNNLTKKKLLLSNECFLKDNINHHLQQKSVKQKSLLAQKLNEDETRSTSNSIKESKKSISSGRNHTIEKKKETLRYIKTKESSHFPPQEPKQYLRLKSPSDVAQTEAKKDEKTYSIKQLLKALIESSSDKQKDQQKNIRKIIDCLTTNDNEPLQDGRVMKESIEKKNCKEKNEEKHSQQTQLTRSPFIRIESEINGFELDQPNENTFGDQQNIQQNDLTKTIRRYEFKIMQLYEELIEEKQKRYRLQEIIQTYIKQKQHQKHRN